MAKCDSFVRYISDVPDEYMQTLKNIAATITEDTFVESSRVFFKSRACAFNVSTYSDQHYSKKLTPEIEKILNWVLLCFPNHSIFWATILSMTPGQRYPVHTDGKKFHAYATRLHIPITYSSDSYHVHFVNDSDKWIETKNVMEEGKIYEFDNITPHSAINNSLEMRHVFVIDVIPTDLLSAHTDWLDVKADTAILTTKVDLEFSKNEQLKFWSYREVSKNAQF